jgi:hypothetical protein
MDITGGYIGLTIILVIAWYLAIFGEVDRSDEKPVSHRVSKKR